MNKLKQRIVPITLFLVLLAFSTSLQSQEKQTKVVKETGDPIARIAIDVGVVVANMEKSLAFYRDLVGLQVVGEITTRLIGKGQMVQLVHGKSLIKLVQMENPPSQKSPEGLTTAFGYRYITLLVTDLATIMTKIEQAEIPVFIPVTELGNGTKIVMVEDPDGNIVEFVQEAMN